MRRIRGLIWRYKNSRRRSFRSKLKRAITSKSKPIALIIIAIAIAWPAYEAYLTNTGEPGTISCYRPHITDGDTLRCNQIRIRLYSIDAPEMNGHCREGRKCVDGDPYASKDYLISITRGIVTCTPIEKDHYGRTVAACKSEQSEDLSCSMVKAGHAIERYGRLRCSA